MSAWSRIHHLMWASPPAVRRLFWRLWYDLVSRFALGRNGGTSFMNYGYVFGEDEGPPPALDPKDEPDRPSIQLYHHLATAVDLAGGDVLEVASGRGGGAAYVMRYLRPRTYVGVDASVQAVSFARRRHRQAGLEFRQGYAEQLPLGDERVDAVLCVEASRCFGSVDRFLAEARRVLRPGGHLLYCDLRPWQHVADWRRALGRSGLDMVRERKITPQVLAALARMSDGRRAWAEARFPRLLVGLFASFAGVRGYETYEGLRSGKYEYLSFILRRPDTPRPPRETT